MKKSIRQRFIIIALVTLAALYVVFWPRQHSPSWQDFTLTGINQTLRENIRLGLDLRGGSHLVMLVRTDEYLQRLTTENAQAAQLAAQQAGHAVSEPRVEAGGNTFSIALDVQDAARVTEARDAVLQKVDFSQWAETISGNTITWELTTNAQRLLSNQAVDQAMSIIDSRINAVGVAEPTLQRHGAEGSNQILLQMPGIDDPERIKRLLGAESRLELVHVIGAPNPSPAQTYATEQEAIASLGGTVPQNRRVLPYLERDDTPAPGTPPQQERQRRYVVVESPPVVVGDELRSAQAVTRGGEQDYIIQFSLKPAGAQKFGDWTGRNINQYMGVVLNDEVRSIAFIRSQITDQGEISGRFTRQTAEDLALTLRSGALPARIEYIEERTVGPSLGADSIRAGVLASIIGFAFVLLFMVFYYRGAGINAVVALFLNLLMMMAALILFDATLTLPGIAGIILTIGMAVDSNVLIFERIREELDTGKTVASAIEQGFARAFTTIIDSNLTTIVAALFLFVFGTGPIRGFAVTLALGLIANLFTAVYVSRTIFMWILSRRGRRAESLSI